MRFLTRAAEADKIMNFGKKPSPRVMKLDLETFPYAMGLIILAIMAFLAAPVTAMVIVAYAARRAVFLLVWACKKMMLKEKAPAKLQAAIPMKLFAAGVALLVCCGFAVYSCYWLETTKFDSTPPMLYRT